MKIEQAELLKTLKVLLVEDDVDLQKDIARFLRYRVGKLIVANHGRQGLELYEEEKPELIITDLDMPVMDGFTMIEKIKSKNKNQAIMIISNSKNQEDLLKAIDLGIKKYIIKPIDNEKLLEGIKEVSISIFSRKKDLVVEHGRYWLNREKKVKIEGEISKKIAFFLKENTGKGPKWVKVFIQGRSIEIKAEEVLTPMELSLMKKRENHELVKYNRKIFYKANYQEIENMVMMIIGEKSRLELINTCVDTNRDVIKLRF